MMRLFGNLMQKYNIKQVSTLKDKCVLVDEMDKFIGPIEKQKAHELSYINSPEGNPHRAFSVFVFNEHYELLMQQRSAVKILFPNYWANTCCSHPLINQNFIPCMINRLKHELNIDLQVIWPNADVKFHFSNKILYKAEYDDIWGEYELDYLFFIKDFKKKWLHNPVNPDEVQDTRWLNREEVPELLEDKEILLAPWLRAIIEKTDFMDKWNTLEKQGTIIPGNKIWDLR